MKIVVSTFVTVMLGAMGCAHAAADPCTTFKWDASREVALHRTTASPLAAGATVAQAPDLRTDTLYALTLKPQETLEFAAPPSKKMLDDGANAGLLKLRVSEAGQYRVAIDSGFWLDIVRDGKTLDSVDFNGSAQCAGPRKIVVYELPANVDLWLQISAAASPDARLTVTRVVKGS
ncbi:MAG: hypothetical protein ABW136_01115 [Steroidobacteraceae bacterium]